MESTRIFSNEKSLSVIFDDDFSDNLNRSISNNEEVKGPVTNKKSQEDDEGLIQLSRH